MYQQRKNKFNCKNFLVKYRANEVKYNQDISIGHNHD